MPIPRKKKRDATPAGASKPPPSSIPGSQPTPPAAPSASAPLTQRDLSRLWTELKAMAHAFAQGEGNRGAVKTTALALTALRRIGPGKDQQRWSEVTWPNRAYFFASARRAMWQALIDYARARDRRPDRVHAGNLASEYLAPLVQEGSLRFSDLMTHASENSELATLLEAALRKLATQRPKVAEATELHLFQFLSTAEIGKHFGVTDRAVRDWIREGRVFLAFELLEEFPQLKSLRVLAGARAKSPRAPSGKPTPIRAAKRAD